MTSAASSTAAAPSCGTSRSGALPHPRRSGRGRGSRACPRAITGTRGHRRRGQLQGCATSFTSATASPCACVPGTIDNDIDGTDACIGFDTALNTIADAVTKVRDTASSHERTFVIEVMGRTSGFLALYAGLACGARLRAAARDGLEGRGRLRDDRVGVRRGKKHAIVMVAEGAAHAFALAEDLLAPVRPGRALGRLGHVQRGGAPSAFDRILGAARMAAHAVHSLIHGEQAFAVGLRCADTVSYPIAERSPQQPPAARRTSKRSAASSAR